METTGQHTGFAVERSATQHQDDEPLSALPLVLQWDLALVRWMVELRESYTPIETMVVMTTSRYRTQDISLLLWLLFLAMLPELGVKYLWICVANLLVVLLLQGIAQVPRPLDVDTTLPSLSMCTDRDTYAFPCVDSHMGIVVLLPLLENTSSRFVQLAFTLVAVYMAATKLWLGTRFACQVLGSWLTGLLGLIVGNHGHLTLRAYKLPRVYNTLALVALVAFLMLVVGHWVENNDSRLIGIPKQDFMDVLSNILQSDGATTTTATDAAPARVHAAHLETTSDGHTRLRQVSGRIRHHGSSDEEEEEEEGEDQSVSSLVGRKDSFYYLLRGMRTRNRHRVPVSSS